MEPSTYKAEQDRDGSWSVYGGNSVGWWVVASGIGSEETARIIARLLQLNSWSADELESGRVDLVRRTHDGDC
jgi:hypothetical protein